MLSVELAYRQFCVISRQN